MGQQETSEYPSLAGEHIGRRDTRCRSLALGKGRRFVRTWPTANDPKAPVAVFSENGRVTLKADFDQLLLIALNSCSSTVKKLYRRRAPGATDGLPLNGPN
jgi:hypothetical protein